jgi:hypothetical protein
VSSLVRCANGHMYDPDRGSCPVCAKVGQAAGPTRPERAGPSADSRPTRPEAPTAPAGGGGSATRPLAHAGRQMSADARTPGVTIARWPEHLNMDPIVGWLVAYEGKSAGRDYRLRGGRMAIGRGPEMDVQIDEDESISRKAEAFVIYDETTHLFYLQPGEQRGLIHLTRKGEQPRLVLAAEQLSAYDAITIGKTKLLFVPLCGPDLHQWQATGSKGDPSRGGGHEDL